MKFVGRISMIFLAVACVYAGARSTGQSAGGPRAQKPVPLKEAKLNIEHNATDHDTGFQGSSTARAGGSSRARTGWKGAQVPRARIAR